MKKHSFDPKEMKQHIFAGKNFEVFFLLSNAKTMVMGRDDPPNFQKGGNFKKVN